jgi:hypothetical protein
MGIVQNAGNYAKSKHAGRTGENAPARPAWDMLYLKNIRMSFSFPAVYF